VQRFLGDYNVSNRSLQELATDRFATSDLYGKLANICGDLPNTALRNTGTFKMLVGNDIITAQKKFIGAFKFRNYAKLMFSTNQPPEPKNDQSHAFFRRWLLITCPRIFQGEDQDPTILRKLTTLEELSGLLNLVIDRLHALLENGGFKETQTTEQIRESYMRKADPIKAFAQDWLVEDEDSFVDKKELYNYYTKYCNINNFSPEGKTKFEDTFRKLGISTLQEKQQRVGNKRPYVFVGITVKQGDLKDLKNQVLLTEKNVRDKKSSIKVKQKFKSFKTVEPKPDIIDRSFFPTCDFCHWPINKLGELSNVKGRPIHKKCLLKAKEGRKGG